jgi:hypothetical protein
VNRISENARAVILASSAHQLDESGTLYAPCIGESFDLCDGVVLRALRITAHLDSLDPADVRRLAEQFRLKAKSRAAGLIASPKSVAALHTLADALDEAGRE